MCLLDGSEGRAGPSSPIAVNRPVCVASWEASRAQLSWKPRDWSASYQGRYASGSDYFLLDLLTWVRVPEAPTSLTLAITFISSDHCACANSLVPERILRLGPQKLEGFRVGSITIVGLSLELEPRHAVQTTVSLGSLVAKELRQAVEMRPAINLIVYHGVPASDARWRPDVGAYGRPERDTASGKEESPEAGDGKGRCVAKTRYWLGRRSCAGIRPGRPALSALRWPDGGDRQRSRTPPLLHRSSSISRCPEHATAGPTPAAAVSYPRDNPPTLPFAALGVVRRTTRTALCLNPSGRQGCTTTFPSARSCFPCPVPSGTMIPDARGLIRAVRRVEPCLREGSEHRRHTVRLCSECVGY